ncbi:hypothetical protein L6452_06380 [Arctium lappa]|uniref:Uncharacterized protein n=1 Tax=Arctium lappa TaxID=4217 RepID=A0ACB9EJP3_ARCLA|nr:hypothetical protein L6452_06380 [Arctium lappa]
MDRPHHLHPVGTTRLPHMVYTNHVNEITVLVNDAEKSGDIDPQEAQQTLEIAEAALRKAEGKRQTIEANLALQIIRPSQ